MRTIQMELVTSLPATVMRFLKDYDVSTEVLGGTPGGGYKVRYHGTYNDLHAMLIDEYGSSESFTGMPDQHRWVRARIDTQWFEVWTDHRPQFDSEVYEMTNELVISLLTNVGYGPDDKDSAGDPISDTVQTLLMEAIFRAPELAGAFRHLDDIQTHAILQFRQLQERRGDL